MDNIIIPNEWYGSMEHNTILLYNIIHHYNINCNVIIDENITITFISINPELTIKWLYCKPVTIEHKKIEIEYKKVNVEYVFEPMSQIRTYTTTLPYITLTFNYSQFNSNIESIIQCLLMNKRFSPKL